MIEKPGRSNIPVLRNGEQEFRNLRKQFDQLFVRLHLSRKEKDSLRHFLNNLPSPDPPHLEPVDQQCYDAFADIILDPPKGTVLLGNEKSPLESWVRRHGVRHFHS